MAKDLNASRGLSESGHPADARSLRRRLPVGSGFDTLIALIISGALVFGLVSLLI